MRPTEPLEHGNTSDDLWRRVAAQLEALADQPYVAEDYRRFRRDVLAGQWAARAGLRTVPASAAVALASPDTLVLRRLLDAIAAAAARYGQGSPDLLRLGEAADTDPALLAALTAWTAPTPDVPALQKLSKRLEVAFDALLLAGRLLAAPFLAPLTQAAAERGLLSGDHADAGGQCPICGALPGIARLDRPDGQRVLHCGLCGASWRFARLACPACGTRDRESLNYVRVGDDAPRWLETCSACGAYLKVVDTRRLPEGSQIWPLVEDTATLHLDLLAEREGCRRQAPYAALW